LSRFPEVVRKRIPRRAVRTVDSEQCGGTGDRWYGVHLHRRDVRHQCACEGLWLWQTGRGKSAKRQRDNAATRHHVATLPFCCVLSARAITRKVRCLRVTAKRQKGDRTLPTWGGEGGDDKESSRGEDREQPTRAAETTEN